MPTVNKSGEANNSAVINEHAGLRDFYSVTTTLSNNKHVRFTCKDDNVENIDWHFTYRGSRLVLQYNVYNGLMLYSQTDKDLNKMHELAGQLRNAECDNG